MKRLIVLLLLLSSLGCGNSVFIEHPGEHPDFEEYCDELDKSLYGTAPKTPIKVPFSGVRDTYLFTPKPEHWEEFNGTVHLTGIEWDVDWIKNASILIGGLSAARYDDGEWETFPNTDLFPAIDVVNDGKSLRFHAKMKADGWKPKGEPEINVNVTVQLCGVNSERITAQYQ